MSLICRGYTPGVFLAAAVLFAASSVKSAVTRYAGDVKAVVLAPASWNHAQWERAALAAGTVGVLMAEDARISHYVQAHRTQGTENIARAVTPFGGGRAVQLSIGMIVAGALAHNDRLRDSGVDSLEAEQISAGIITPLLKRGIGRARPNQDEMTPDDFDSWHGQESFPSGHATNAFAFASAIAAHARGWLVPSLAYTLASSVAVARVHDNVHWTSDVAAGALIGGATGRFIAHRHEKQASHASWSVVPLYAPHRFGAAIRASVW